MVKSQATTMKIRNRNGRSHAAFSALDTPLSRFSSATSRSLLGRLFGIEINPLDKYWQARFVRYFVVPAWCAIAPRAGAHTPCPTGKSAILLSSPAVKNIPLNLSGKSAALLRASHGRSGAGRDRHERAVGCGGRGRR